MRQHSGRISPLKQGWNYSLQASCVLIRSFSASRRCFLFSGPWLPFPEYFPGNHYRPETGRNSFSRSHFTEIQPGHIKVRFSLPAGIPQENQHEEKEDQSPSHFKGIAGYHPLHTDAVAGEGKPLAQPWTNNATNVNVSALPSSAAPAQVLRNRSPKPTAISHDTPRQARGCPQASGKMAKRSIVS